MKFLINLILTLLYLFFLVLIIPIVFWMFGMWGLGGAQEGGLSFIIGFSVFLFSGNSTWYTFLLWLFNKNKMQGKFYYVPLFFLSLTILLPLYTILKGWLFY